VRSLELEVDGIRLKEFKQFSSSTLEEIIAKVDDRRFFAIIELMWRGYSKRTIYQMTHMTMFFLNEMKRLIDLEKIAQTLDIKVVSDSTLLALKQAGFTNQWIAQTCDCTKQQVEALLTRKGICATYEAIEAFTEQKEINASYYYAVWRKTEKQAL